MVTIKTLFLDIGGVLMTNGWDRQMREKAAQAFDIDLVEFEKRHHQYFGSLEKGTISLERYLDQVVFWTERGFSLQKFKEFIFSQSKPFSEMINYFSEIKKEFKLHVAAISNEGRELAEYRINYGNLTSFIDDFFISSFLGYQKPDLAIYKVSLDITQTDPEEAIFIDDREENVKAALSLGFHAIQHVSFIETRKKILKILA